MSPIVNDNLVTAADNLEHKCPKCKTWFKDTVHFICEKCRPTIHKFELGWDNPKKDITVFSPDWSYGRLNIETMKMERVPIDREGKKYNYLDYQISTAIEDKKIEIIALKRVNGERKTPKELKQEIKLEKEIEKRDIEADKQEGEVPGETEREKKKEQKEVMKLIDKK